MPLESLKFINHLDMKWKLKAFGVSEIHKSFGHEVETLGLRSLNSCVAFMVYIMSLLPQLW